MHLIVEGSKQADQGRRRESTTECIVSFETREEREEREWGIRETPPYIQASATLLSETSALLPCCLRPQHLTYSTLGSEIRSTQANESDLLLAATDEISCYTALDVIRSDSVRKNQRGDFKGSHFVYSSGDLVVLQQHAVVLSNWTMSKIHGNRDP
jgi:hypothetical protein